MFIDNPILLTIAFRKHDVIPSFFSLSAVKRVKKPDGKNDDPASARTAPSGTGAGGRVRVNDNAPASTDGRFKY